MQSDNLSPIIDKFAIVPGRYVDTGPTSQRFLSTTDDGEGSIAMPHEMGKQLGEGGA